MTFCKRMLKISFNVIYHPVVIDKHTAFKMQIQTPVIQINGTNSRRIIIRHKYFRMHKPRSIFIYLNSCFKQLLIISFC